MVAYRQEAAGRCQLCGTADWEWDPKQGGRKYAYEGQSRECKGCAIKETIQTDSDKRPGITITLIPTRTIEWAQGIMLRQRRDKKRRERAARGLEG